MSEQLALLPNRLTAHVQLTLLALFFSTAFSLPVGIMITRVRWLQQPVLGIAGVIQTIPSLALLAILVVLLQSFGFLPAIIALTAYGVLPVLVNTVTGITGVDAALKEAARGVGMTPLQQLRRVELPLAMPVIVAGIRTSTVLIVGIATLSTPVGATSLGNYIFEGLQTRNNAAVLVGCVAAALLALSLDGLVRALEASIRNRRRLGVTISLTLLGALYGYTGVTLASRFLWTGAEPITIGSKTFTEQVHSERGDRETDRGGNRLSDPGHTVTGVYRCLRRTPIRQHRRVRRLLGYDLGDPDASRHGASRPD